MASQVYSGTTDPYLSFLSDSHSLFSTKPTSNGKKSDPLKFSDPLSFGTSDPLSYGVSDPLRFSDPLSFGNSSTEKSRSDPLAFPGDEPGGGETTETESKHESEDDWEDASAPPADYLERVQGYEMVSFDTVSVPPPVEDPDEKKEGDDEKADEKESAAGVVATETAVNLTHQQARAALLSHVSNKCCYGSGAAKQLQITSMDYVPAHHYELQTFTEKRETSWTYAPHKGGEVDGPGRGGAPLPWDMEEPPANMFKEEVRVVTVPHTGVVKACHKCRGTGGMSCRDCSGKGWVRCLHCHGDVYLSEHGSGGLGRDRCYYCQHSKHGHGHQDCSKCQAKGKVSCATCEGTAHIRCYIQLSITWRVNTAEHIVEKLNIPEDLIRDVSGQVAFEEEMPKVFPVDAFNDDVIKMASSQLVASHAANFLDQRILRQRHQVRIVPVTRVNYEWKGRGRSFYVYGYENKVHLPGGSYPHTCCWGCQVM